MNKNEILFLVGMAFFVFIVLVVAMNMIRADRKNSLKDGMNHLQGFSPSNILFSVDGKRGLAYDEETHSICIASELKKTNRFKVVKYSDILSFEIFEDGDSISKTSRSGQVGGALIGGIALGGVGAIIGGLSASSKTTNTINTIELRVTINDIRDPIHSIVLLNFEQKRTSSIYKQADSEARKWKAIIEILILNADKEAEASTV